MISSKPLVFVIALSLLRGLPFAFAEGEAITASTPIEPVPRVSRIQTRVDGNQSVKASLSDVQESSDSSEFKSRKAYLKKRIKARSKQVSARKSSRQAKVIAASSKRLRNKAKVRR
jgi:hypothetical protein